MKEIARIETLEDLQINCDLDDDAIQSLSKLKNLKSLFIGASTPSESVWKIIPEFPKLTSLDLHDTAISDSGIEELTKCPRVTKLTIVNPSELTDQSLESLANMKILEALTLLGAAKVTEGAVRKLQTALPKCRIVSDYPDVAAMPEPAADLGSTKPAAEMAKAETQISTADPERFVAEWVLAQPGDRELTVRSVGPENIVVRQIQDLPPKDFFVTGISLLNGATDALNDEILARFGQLKKIELLFLRPVQPLEAITDKGIENFLTSSVSESLRGIVIEGVAPNVTVDGYLHLNGTQSLGTLRIGLTPQQTAVLPQLKLPKLDVLSISTVGDGETAKGLLKGLASRSPDLNLLALARMHLSQEDVEAVAKLDLLYLSHLEDCGLSDADLEPLSQLPGLGELILDRNPELTDDGLAHLAKLKLKGHGEFSFRHNAQLTGTGLDHLVSVEGLKSVDFSHTSLNDEACQALASLPLLESARLGECRITDAGLAALSTSKTLKLLYVPACKRISDRGLESLTKMSSLTELYIQNNPQLTEPGVRKLQAALPKCRIVSDFPDVAAMPAPEGDPDRRAAEYALSVGCRYLVIKENGQELPIAAIADLPQGPFELTVADLTYNSMVTDAGLDAFKGCKHLTMLQLGGVAGVTDAGIENFEDCNDLTLIGLSGTQVTDAGLAVFSDCKNVTELHLGYTKVTDVGLAHFKDCSKMSVLRLHGAPVTDAGLAYFKDCRLNALNVTQTGVSDAGLLQLTHCEDLTVLSVETPKISDAGLVQFKGIKNLVQLELTGTLVTDAGLEYFKDSRKLTTLVVAYTAVTDLGLKNFQGCRLRVLYLNDTQVTDTGLSHINDLSELTYLFLDSTMVTDAGVSLIGQSKKLASLQLYNTPVSDASLATLAGLPNVTLLHLDRTRISRRGYEQLKAAMPKCNITWSEPNREVAEVVLGLGGTIEIGTLSQLGSRPVAAVSELPADFFQVRRISLAGVTKPLDPLVAISPGKQYVLLSDLKSTQFDQLESVDLAGHVLPDYAFLAPIHGLQELNLSRSGLNDETLAKFPVLPTLKRLVLDGCEIRGTGLAALKHQPALTDLSLACPSLGDLFAANLAELTQLQHLVLADTKLTDEGIKQLVALTALESLDLRRTQATAAGIATLQAALPKCRIVSDFSEVESK